MKDLVTQSRAKNVALMYHDADVKDVLELRKHLALMVRNGVIKVIDKADSLETMPFLHIILAFMSPDAMSDDVLVNGVNTAVEHTRARVIPIVLREVNLKRDLPRLGAMQGLPRNGKPVSGQKKGQAFCDIAQEIYRVATEEED